MTAPVRIANISGFYGDSPFALEDILAGEPVDYITGDYLAELTMLILAKDKAKNPEGGYAKTFPAQLDTHLATLAERGTTVISNAGGMNPAGLAEQLRQRVAEQGLDLTVAHVDGDDLLAHSAQKQA